MLDGNAQALADISIKLRQWVCSKNANLSLDDVREDTPIIERRLINSLQIMDLILYIEHISGAPIEVSAISAGAFSSVNNIVQAFFVKENTRCV